ncbi:isoaspartyl peptidase/L-asparaginase isoform X2 [Anthonomus grandis grandis]|uniref:isoaspartyl peptidase/L-asparaginase isoform X2 n=1 Tax=Anthonomus grandis grandis TaxID=2921223 RepID=UPI0021662134|nr:isoaspartyl peptidase/L-asparaginase isoform X2 [Anthonomus grandis grandis]
MNFMWYVIIILSAVHSSFPSSSHPKPMEPIVLVHGGAGDIPDSRVQPKLSGNRKAVDEAYAILKNGGGALEAVEAAVRVMEDDEAFNAGYGSVLNLEGEVEMDASIMDGNSLNAGAVTVVKDIANPISLARLVMEKTPHVLLAGQGANKFATEQGVSRVPPGGLVSPFAIEALNQFKLNKDNRTEIGAKNPGEVGTVGAVALDQNGNLAAATSTGGINGKMVGRSSDTCMIGSGTYADNSIGAVSTTGHGETIAKFCLAHAIIKDMEYKNSTADRATKEILNKMKLKLNNTAGAITLSKCGQVGIGFNSKRMSWGYRKGSEYHYGIEQGQHEIKTIKN